LGAALAGPGHVSDQKVSKSLIRNQIKGKRAIGPLSSLRIRNLI